MNLIMTSAGCEHILFRVLLQCVVAASHLTRLTCTPCNGPIVYPPMSRTSTLHYSYICAILKSSK